MTMAPAARSCATAVAVAAPANRRRPGRRPSSRSPGDVDIVLHREGHAEQRQCAGVLCAQRLGFRNRGRFLAQADEHGGIVVIADALIAARHGLRRRHGACWWAATIAATDPAAAVESVRTVAERIAANIDQVIEGKHDTVRLGVAVLLAEGHLLIEDVPGVGKTKFAKALARSIDCSVRRVQFTPDLLPSDVTGVSVYNAEDRDFEFKPGPVFANIVVGDEINRASPKTQSALLECMEERQVTVDGVTYALESPFLVLATQNPIDMEGTYPLPEAQRDRFTARISMGYPDRRAEIQMLGEHASLDPLDSLRPVSDAREVRALIAGVRAVHVADTDQGLRGRPRRGDPVGRARSGSAPRRARRLQLLRAAKAWAALEGRDYVLPDDMQFMLDPGARAPDAADRRRARVRTDRRRRPHRPRPARRDPRRRQRPGPPDHGRVGTRRVHHPRVLPARRRRHRARVRLPARASSTWPAPVCSRWPCRCSRR